MTPVFIWLFGFFGGAGLGCLAVSYMSWRGAERFRKLHATCDAWLRLSGGALPPLPDNNTIANHFWRSLFQRSGETE